MQTAVVLSLVGHVEADWQSSPLLMGKKKVTCKKNLSCKRHVIDIYITEQFMFERSFVDILLSSKHLRQTCLYLSSFKP